jgi:hypothetical protein
VFHCRETHERHISGWYRTQTLGGLARAHHTSRLKVLRRDSHPQSYLRTQEAALLHEDICQSVVTACIVCRYQRRSRDIASITNLQERLHTRSIAIFVANVCVLAQRNSKINAVTCHLSQKFEQYRYLDPKVRPPLNNFPSSKRVNCCVLAHIFALPSSMRRASH